MDEQALFSADMPDRFAAGPPGNPPVSRVFDVLLVTHDPAVPSGGYEEYPPILQPTFPRGPGGSPSRPNRLTSGTASRCCVSRVRSRTES
jgi:hypothetical protein